MQDRKRETADALQNVGGDSSRKRRAITHTFIIIALSGTVRRCTAPMCGLSEGFSRAKRSYKQIYFSGGFYYGNYHNERDPRL